MNSSIKSTIKYLSHLSLITSYLYLSRPFSNFDFAKLTLLSFSRCELKSNLELWENQRFTMNGSFKQDYLSNCNIHDIYYQESQYDL